MAGIEQVVTVRYVREHVEGQEKTHREVSDILRQEHPGVQGLSERSVRRYCATNGIRRHDSHLTRGAVDEPKRWRFLTSRDEEPRAKLCLRNGCFSPGACV